METQAKAFKETMDAMTEEELEEKIDLWQTGHLETKAMMLMHLVLKAFVAYKTQLFLYIKATGNTSIGTSNLWRGVDEAK